MLRDRRPELRPLIKVNTTSRGSNKNLKVVLDHLDVVGVVVRTPDGPVTYSLEEATALANRARETEAKAKRRAKADTPTDRRAVISTLLFDAGGTLVMPNFRRMADEFARDGVAIEPERLARAEAQARLDFERPDFVRSHPGDIWLSYMHDVARKAEIERPPLAAFERLRAYHDSENLWEQPIAGTEAALTELGARYRLG